MLPCQILTIYMTILTCFYNLFPIETTIVYNLWNVLYIPFIFTFRQGSKVAESGRHLMITIGKVVNKCHDEKVIDKVKFSLVL